MGEMENIVINVGVYTAIQIDLTDIDFENVEKVILTIKSFPDVKLPPLIEREYIEGKIYTEIINPEESLLLTEGAVYDFNCILKDGTRHKITGNGNIVLIRGVGNV